jgi:hypothetical protein
VFRVRHRIGDTAIAGDAGVGRQPPLAHSPESERNWHFCDRVAAAFRRADAGRPQPFPWGSQLARAADYCFGPIVSSECATTTAARCAVSALCGALIAAEERLVARAMRDSRHFCLARGPEHAAQRGTKLSLVVEAAARRRCGSVIALACR